LYVLQAAVKAPLTHYISQTMIILFDIDDTLVDHGSAIPCGFTRAGLPTGLQISAPSGADAMVLRVARAS